MKIINVICTDEKEVIFDDLSQEEKREISGHLNKSALAALNFVPAKDRNIKKIS